MPAPDAQPHPQQVLVGAAAVFGSQVSINLGAAFAKQLFPLVGACGVTALRITIAAILLVAFRRPWRRPVSMDRIPALIVYGAMMGLMNLLIYQAFARIPIGIAVGIEVIGRLTIVLLSSRGARDFLWLGAAVAGLLLLLPLRSSDALDPIGVGFACGAAACWALYIVYGKRVAASLGADAVAWGMVISAILTFPLGVASAGASMFAPHVLLVGLAVGFLSGAIPFSLEMEAMRRVPANVLGMLFSAYPAVAALAGFIVLGEHLTLIQVTAIACIMIASAGSAFTSAKTHRE